MAILFMRFLAWNIQHGGGPIRMPHIALALLEARADLVALCEYRARRGGQLRALLCDHGFSSQLASNAAPTDNAILIASRHPIDPGPDLEIPPHLRRRWATAILDTPLGRVTIAMVHVPDDTHPSDKAAFWQGLCAFGNAHRSEAAIILGDFNTARREDIRSGFRTRCDAKIGQLAAYGFGDAYSIANALPTVVSVTPPPHDDDPIVPDGPSPSPPNTTPSEPQLASTPPLPPAIGHASARPNARPISWKGPLNQASRIDAAYVSRSLHPRVRACSYQGLEPDSSQITGKPIGFPQSPAASDDAHPSDHAMLLLDIALDGTRERACFTHVLGS